MESQDRHTVELGKMEQEERATSPPLTSPPPPPPPPQDDPQLSTQPLDKDQSLEPLQMPEPALRPALTRNDTEPPIGPSTDLPTPIAQPILTAHEPVININLLLTSTGTRHPYKIDHKYLSKRGVTAEGEDGAFDPFVISVYTLKELIWRDWREEWEPRPSSPSAIRLIHFGRFLDDKLPLKDCRFSETAPNVVHMSVKPQEAIEDEENAKASGKGSSSRDRDQGEPTAGCRCVIL